MHIPHTHAIKNKCLLEIQLTIFFPIVFLLPWWCLCGQPGGVLTRAASPKMCPTSGHQQSGALWFCLLLLLSVVKPLCYLSQTAGPLSLALPWIHQMCGNHTLCFLLCFLKGLWNRVHQSTFPWPIIPRPGVGDQSLGRGPELSDTIFVLCDAGQLLKLGSAHEPAVIST